MQSITVADGLSQGFITALYQDRQGFIWIGTLDGLNRYDGYSVRRFTNQPFNPFSLSNSAYITHIQEDTEGLLWIGTSENIYVFDPATERFFNIGLQTDRLPKGGVMTITMDGAGTIFIHAPDANNPIGIFRMVVPRHFGQQLRHHQAPLNGVAVEPVPVPPDMSAPVNLMPCVADTLLLVRNWKGQAARWVSTHARFEPYDLVNIQTGSPADYSILWNKETGSVFRSRLPDGQQALTLPDAWREVVRLRDGNRVTFNGMDNVLYKMTTEEPIPSLLALNLRKDPLFTPFLRFSYPINAVLVDRGEVIWAGTGGRGVQKVNLRSLAFHHFLPEKSIYNLREMSDGRIWSGKFSPYALLNLSTGQLEPAFWASFFKDQQVYNLLNDSAGNIWFIQEGTKEGKPGSIVLWEKTGRQYREVASIPAYREMIAEQLMEDKQGNIWVAAHEGHLFRCRADDRSTASFDFSSTLADDKNLTSYAICEDSEGRIWIGTNRGLVEARNPGHEGGPTFDVYLHNPADTQSLNRSWVMCICADPADPNLLWVGTRGGGLNCLNKKTRHFTHFIEANGLADNVVYGIVPDDDGNLWCSTNRGLSRFTPRTGLFVNYLESDGLPNNEFNTGAYLRISDGRLLFGGVNGLTILVPDDIKRSTYLPPAVITGLRVRGSLLEPAREGSPLQFAPGFEQMLTLPFDQNNVTFEFAALDFANSSTNRFRYQMAGLDHNWIYSGTGHSANYASLPPGKYTFQVQAATADGDWNPQPATFVLVILPPWYRSWIAYLLYFLTAVGLAWWYIRFRERRLRVQHSIELEQQELGRLKELNVFKNRLFANITHEFRTPLTLILGLAERLRRDHQREDVPSHAKNIILQSNDLLDLVNQMLDLTKLDSNELILHEVQGNLSAFIRYQMESFQSLAKHKSVQLTVETELPDLMLDFDPQRFRQILANLLSNAIRHTPPGGVIVVRLCRPDEHHAALSVSDTGEGIAPDDLPYIFERFYQGRSSRHEQGTGGIGLALTRELAVLAGGEIRAESTPGQGATLTVTLPIRNEAPVLSGDSTVKKLRFEPTAVPQPSTETAHLPLLLLIEDNAVVADYLQLCLHGHYRLHLASNGEKGIQKAFDLIPDLVLSDVMMPLKDGFEVTNILKNDDRTSHIPIVLLTAKTQLDDRLEGRRRGANAYLTKPFNEEELLLVLANLLDIQRRWKIRYAAGPPPEPPAVELSVTSPDAFHPEDEFMKKIYGIFEKNYAEETFNLDQLCRLTGMSSSQLHRKLAALTGQPAIQMLRTYRLNKAHELLRTRPDLNVSEVCFMVGFKNSAHFSRLFSKMFGRPPSEVV